MTDFNQNIKTAVTNSGYYDQLWPTLGRKLDYTEVNRARFIVDSLQEYLGQGNLQILDFGCGRGWLAPFLAPFGTVTAIDFSEVGIDFAKSNYGNYANFILADPDSDTLGLPPALKFDVIISSEVIEHVLNHSNYIEQIYAFLKPHGWLMLTTPNGNVWSEYSIIPLYRSRLQPIENWLTPKDLNQLLEEKGFKIYRHEGRPYYEFRQGASGVVLQRWAIWQLFRMFKSESLYFKFILPTALYQMVVAQKVK
jgi:2-polyprenyl-3-methyl-5-hydroxy-6-metoxy-1,4-benzoquinol methylase